MLHRAPGQILRVYRNPVWGVPTDLFVDIGQRQADQRLITARTFVLVVMGGRVEMVRQVELVEVIGRLTVRARSETGRLVRGW